MTDENEPVIEYGTVEATITDGTNPIKNVKIVLTTNQNTYSCKTNKDGECTIEEVAYDDYNVKLTHTGYVPEETTLTVDDETVTFEATLSHEDPNPDIVEVDLDETYTFNITERTIPYYSISAAISEWLVSNLASLTDDNDNIIFSKVNTGFNENTLKTFGKKPVCDVYIDSIEYDTDFDCSAPKKVKTIVLFYMKGANNNAYLQCCALHDYIMQEFIENETFRRLEDVVLDTYITNSELMSQPINKKWGVMGAFELSHTLY